MAGAVAVVDFERDRLLAQDVVEAVLCATPVVVPEHGAARHVAEATGGGVWYRNHADIRAAVAAFSDGLTRDRIGRAGQAEAHRRYTDIEAFGRRVAGALRPPVTSAAS
jgi:glycosyltransferase involved in cell wall biosynthesis